MTIELGDDELSAEAPSWLRLILAPAARDRSAPLRRGGGRPQEGGVGVARARALRRADVGGAGGR